MRSISYDDGGWFSLSNLFGIKTWSSIHVERALRLPRSHMTGGALSAVFVSYDLFPQRDILGFERSLVRIYDSLLLEAMF